MRDDFPNPVVETLAKRVGNRCSNPTCRKRTSGPHTNDNKALNVGVAAHITAASAGGHRYDPSISSEDRKGIGNGIWLCQSCAKLVDNDETRYTKGLLLQWKQDAEQEALREIESARSIETGVEPRAVPGPATLRKDDELLAHFSAMLKGRSLANLGPVPDPFEQEIEQLQNDLKFNQEWGGWWMSFRPVQYTADRWCMPEELERLIASHSVHIHDEFPGHQRGTFRMGWGIANDFYWEKWALTHSGLFCCWKEFDENKVTAERTGYRGGDEAKRPIPPGEWVEYTWAIRTVVDFFMFQSRFVNEYGPGEGVHVSFKVGPLVGRKLVALNPNIVLGGGAPEPCRAPFFTYERTIESESSRTNWEQDCAGLLKRFVGLFPNHRISQETLLKWVEKCKTRGF